MRQPDARRRGVRRAGGAALVALAAAAGVAVGLGATGGGDGRVGPAPAPVAADSPLAGAPWLRQPDGSPRLATAEPRASLVFPAGTTYAGALDRIYRSAVEDGAVPAGAALAPALPREVVLVTDSGGTGALRVSLTAPFGVSGDGRILPPSVRLPGHLTPDEVHAALDAMLKGRGALPDGVQVDVPALRPCQVAVERPENHPACTGEVVP